jgi:hypothetical protein
VGEGAEEADLFGRRAVTHVGYERHMENLGPVLVALALVGTRSARAISAADSLTSQSHSTDREGSPPTKTL